METDQRPLDKVLFGTGPSDVFAPDVDLAEAISAWFRASQSKLHKGDGAGSPQECRHESDSPRSR